MIWQGVKFFCLPEVIDTPVVHDDDVLQEEFPDVFGTCVVTRAKAQKFRDTVDLSESFMCPDNSAKAEENVGNIEIDVCPLPGVDLPVGKPMSNLWRHNVLI